MNTVKSNSIHSKIIIFMFWPVTVSRGRISSGPLQLILDRLYISSGRPQVARTRTGIRYVSENTRLSIAMDLVDLILLTVLLGGVVLAVATLWARRGTRARLSEEERVGPPA